VNPRPNDAKLVC